MVKGVEHISTNLLVNLRVARVRVPLVLLGFEFAKTPDFVRYLLKFLSEYFFCYMLIRWHDNSFMGNDRQERSLRSEVID